MSNNRKGAPVRRASFPVHYLLPVDNCEAMSTRFRSRQESASATTIESMNLYQQIWPSRHHPQLTNRGIVESDEPPGRHGLPSGPSRPCTSVTCTNTIV